MKKTLWLFLLLILACVVAFSACNRDNSVDNNNDNLNQYDGDASNESENENENELVNEPENEKENENENENEQGVFEEGGNHTQQPLPPVEPEPPVEHVLYAKKELPVCVEYNFIEIWVDKIDYLFYDVDQTTCTFDVSFDMTSDYTVGEFQFAFSLTGKDSNTVKEYVLEDVNLNCGEKKTVVLDKEFIGSLPRDDYYISFYNVQENYPYAVGLLSDIHVSASLNDDTQSQADFARALSYYEQQRSMMILAAGDLTVNGTDGEFAKYKEIRDTSSVPIFEVTGNHEASSGRTYKANITNENCIAYKIYDLVGKDFCYYLKGNKYVGWRLCLGEDGVPYGETVEFESGVTVPNEDVYIFVGILGDANNGLFFKEELQWLKDVLEQNRNDRCFVIEHCRADRLRYDTSQNKYVEDRYAEYTSGNYGGKYIKPLWGQANNDVNGKNARCFEELMSHYTNCIWIHGHSHMSAKTAVSHGATPYLYDTHFGDAYHPWALEASAKNTKHSYSIHVSSCAEPREESGVNPSGSEGCFMIVEREKVIIRYVDFTTSEILIEYTISTSKDTIEAGTFVDPTGLTN